MCFFSFERKILFPEKKNYDKYSNCSENAPHTIFFMVFYFYYYTTTAAVAAAAAVQIHYDDTRAVYIVCI